MSHIKNIAASIRQRLLNYSKIYNDDFTKTLRLYVIERLLYRLSQSDYADAFTIKGSWLFFLWNKNNRLHRPTLDVDMLSYGDNDVAVLEDTFRIVCSGDFKDGLVFDIETIKGIVIKDGDLYKGVRITGVARLGNAKIPYQADIGFGDTVIPAPQYEYLPASLDLPLPYLQVYPVYSVVSEKFQAAIKLDIMNTRMKDFYDLLYIARLLALEGNLLVNAIQATFEKRKTDIVSDSDTLFIFSDKFSGDKTKTLQWNAWLGKNKIIMSENFSDIICLLKGFLGPAYNACLHKRDWNVRWNIDDWRWNDI